MTAEKCIAYVGCFTTQERKARGKGISAYLIDEAAGAWTLIQVIDTPPNPQFLALDHRQNFLYAAHGSHSEISAYSIDKTTGKLEFLNKQPTGGNNGSHVSIDPTNRYVVLAIGPGVAVYPINQDGSLAAFSDRVLPAGVPGPRTEHSHPHQVLFDLTGRFLLVPDHGIDKVHVYRLDAATGKLVPNDPPSVKTRYGTAPRHLTFHPAKPFAYVLHEHESTVGAYHWNSERGALEPFQTTATAPTSYTGKNTCSEIAITASGNFVYASNRGHDSIAIFAVDGNTGMLSPVAWEPTQGRKPRFFTLDPSGNLLYAANEDTDTIVAFRVDRESGKLTPTGRIVETGSPSCIVFARC